MTGRSPGDIQDAIIASLVGNNLVGTYLNCSLAKAIVDQDTASTFFEVVNGSVVVTYEGGRALSAARTPQATGGRIQRMYAHQYRARVTYSNRVAAGQGLASDVASFAQQIVDLIEAGLEPQSGEQYDIPADGIQIGRVFTHTKDPGFNVQDVFVTVRAFWAR